MRANKVILVFLTTVISAMPSAAASLSVGSAEVSSDGSAVAIKIKGIGAGPLRPATGITGFTVLSDGASNGQTSAAVTGPDELRIALRVKAWKGQAVTLSYNEGNLSDGGEPASILNAFSNLEVTNTSSQQKPVFYVSPSGDDVTGTGSIEKPWKTYQKAVGTVNVRSGGDVIVFREGTYETTGEGAYAIRKPNITLRSYPGERAHITAPLDKTGTRVTVLFLWGTGAARVENLEVSGGYYAIMFRENYAPDKNGPVGGIGTWVKNCRIHDTFADAIKLAAGNGMPGAFDVVIEGNEIYRTGVDPSSTNAQGIDAVQCDRLLVRGNYLHDVLDNAIAIKGGSEDAVIEKNYIENVPGTGIAVGQDTGEDYFDHQSNPNSYEIIRAVARNNVVVGAKYGGIQVWASKDSKVVNNTLINVAREGQGGIWITGHYHYVGWSDYHSDTVVNEGLSVMNNVVVLPATSQRFGVYITETGYRTADVPFFANNRYYQAGKALRYFDAPGGYFTGSLAQWKAHMKSDTSSSEGDPALAGDYHLKSGSPCIDAGADASAFLFDDRDGQLRRLPFDIGADEYVAPLTVPLPPAGLRIVN